MQAPDPMRVNVWRDWLLQTLFWSFLVFWTVMAINPVSRSDWLLENLLVFLTCGTLVGTFRRFQFSHLSYFLITLFLLLHTYGAHHTYSQAPFAWLNGLLADAGRNNFDRLVHLAYGLLMVYPVWEMLRRLARVTGAWSYLLAVMVIVATGAFYELIEMWVAQIVAPELGEAFLGAQGDVWDAQQDIALALYGSVAVMGLTAAGLFICCQFPQMSRLHICRKKRRESLYYTEVPLQKFLNR